MKYVCTDCPRMCGAIRDQYSGNGYCRMGIEPVAARAALHFDEEPVISGTRGSGAVFFTGCSLRCCYCQNYPISHENFGKPLSTIRLRQVYNELILQGAHNINLVNPTHFAEPILRSLQFPLSVPVIWNSSGYERVETLRRFEESVQVYLPDLKYIRAETARKYSGAANYFEFAAPALKEMLRQVGPVRLDKNGLIQSGMIVRHLVLPGCADESIEILDWIADNLPGAWVSLMAQYVPCGKVEGVDELNRRITQDEYDRVSNHLFELGLDDGFVQELSASDKQYIPPFDLSGVW